MFVGKNEGLGPSPSNGSEFHQGLIIAGRIETDRYVLGLFFVDEEYAPEQDPLGIEGWISWPVGTDLGGGQLLLLDVMQLHPLAAFGSLTGDWRGGSFMSRCHRRVTRWAMCTTGYRAATKSAE